MQKHRGRIRLSSFGSSRVVFVAFLVLRSIRAVADCPRGLSLVAPRRNPASASSKSLLSSILVPLCIAACGQVVVRPSNSSLWNDAPRPSRIVVGEFSASNAAIFEYQGIFRQQPSNRNVLERQRLLASGVSEALSAELLTQLKGLGFLVERQFPGIPAGNDFIAIEGELIRVDEGNPLRRFVVGLGYGTARVQTRLVVYQGSERSKLLEFTTDADSGQMPGAAITFVTGSVAPTIVSAGLLTANVLATRLQSRHQVNQLARSSAARAAQCLADYFVAQKWIQPDQLRKAPTNY
jgi:Domain of unknown function (DUF4410)